MLAPPLISRIEALLDPPSFSSLSSFPAPPSRLPHPLLASDTLRVPPPLFFLLVSHPTCGREEFPIGRAFSGRSSLTLLIWRNHQSTPHREVRRHQMGARPWLCGEKPIVFPIGRVAGATPNGRPTLVLWRNVHSTPHREGRRCGTKWACALVIWRLSIGRAAEFRAAGAKIFTI